eukprot:9165719-Ditylum_brightwellii.AAC.1
MTAQLLDHPHRTEGCLGFFKPNATKDEQIWNTMQGVLGWKNQTEFLRVATPPKHPSEGNETETKQLVPEEWQPAMDSWTKGHKRVVNLCQAN